MNKVTHVELVASNDLNTLEKGINETIDKLQTKVKSSSENEDNFLIEDIKLQNFPVCDEITRTKDYPNSLKWVAMIIYSYRK